MFSSIFSAQFQGWGQYFSFWEFYGHQFKMVFNFLQAVEAVVLGDGGQVSCDLFNDLWFLDPVRVRFSSISDLVLEAVVRRRFWLWIDNSDDVIPE